MTTPMAVHTAITHTAVIIAYQLFAEEGFLRAPRKQQFSGNPSLPGCEIFHGWTFKLRSTTTPKERKALKAAGWSFSGGWWRRCNDVPTSVVVETNHGIHKWENPDRLSFCEVCGCHRTSPKGSRFCTTLASLDPAAFTQILDSSSRDMLILLGGTGIPAVTRKTNPITPLLNDSGTLTPFGQVVRAHVVLADPECTSVAHTAARARITFYQGETL